MPIRKPKQIVWFDSELTVLLDYIYALRTQVQLGRTNISTAETIQLAFEMTHYSNLFETVGLITSISGAAPGKWQGHDTKVGIQTGLALYAEVRKINPELPIVVFTYHDIAGAKFADMRQDPRCLLLSKQDLMPFSFPPLIANFFGLKLVPNNI